MTVPDGSTKCGRCFGKGIEQSIATGDVIDCLVCHGWGHVAKRRPRPPNDDGLIALHCDHRPFDEVVALLPLVTKEST